MTAISLTPDVTHRFVSIAQEYAIENGYPEARSRYFFRGIYKIDDDGFNRKMVIFSPVDGDVGFNDNGFIVHINDQDEAIAISPTD